MTITSQLCFQKRLGFPYEKPSVSLPGAACVCRHKPGFPASAAGDTSPTGATSLCLSPRPVPTCVNVGTSGRRAHFICSAVHPRLRPYCLGSSLASSCRRTGAHLLSGRSSPHSPRCDKSKSNICFAKASHADGRNATQPLDFQCCR